MCVCVCVFLMSEYVGGCGRYIAKSVNCVHVRLASRECYGVLLGLRRWVG